MKLKIALLALLACTACAKSSLSRSPTAPSLAGQAGHDQGNGADYFSEDDGAAWFMGTENTIHFCVQSAPDFGFSQNELEAKVIRGFQRWSDYINEKHVHSLKAPAKFTALASCDGSEDIRFLFGTTSGEVKQNLARFKNPVAMTVRTSYDQLKGWGKGFMWIAPNKSVYGDFFPNWSLTGNLDTILLHELGHVHGVGHVKGTIMDEEISAYLNRGPEQKALPLLHDIDGDIELVICISCQEAISGHLGVHVTNDRIDKHEQPRSTPVDTSAEVFNRLTGRQPRGQTHAEVTQIVSPKGIDYRLDVRDDAGSFAFNIHINTFSIATTEFQPVFKTIISSDPIKENGKVVAYGETRTDSTERESISMQGKLTTKNGESLHVAVQRNMSMFQPLPKPEPYNDVVGIISSLIIAIEEDSGAKVIFMREQL